MSRLTVGTMKLFSLSRAAALTRQQVVAASSQSTKQPGASSGKQQQDGEIKKVPNASPKKNDGSFKGAEEILHEAYNEGNIKDNAQDKGAKHYTPAQPPGSSRKFSTSASLGAAGDNGGRDKKSSPKETANPIGQVVGKEGLESTDGARPQKYDGERKRDLGNAGAKKLPQDSATRSDKKANTMSDLSPSMD